MKRQTTFRTSMASPCNVKIHVAKQPVASAVADDFDRCCKALQKFAREQTVKRQESRVDQSASDFADSSSKKGTPASRPPSLGSLLKSALFVGVNRVTRGVERSDCRAVIAFRDLESSALINHLPVLCVFRDVPLVLLPDSKRFRDGLGLSRVAALGVKTEAQMLQGIEALLSGEGRGEHRVGFSRG
eukprot:Cvel_34280.t2-p1 / transcript=Cvel_34280.t2 / gene=Cvel_34280 / organism=Chromera_velia_CCMP2878 / gene_product=50S ribosomal protein L7Ae, putative / transcript_product=50S ribosomal protein L7Ae, putative / location=Cvel_scaffold5823:393-2279(-) / protein_length=186 / sequence_SO=supercontig / SO=protein_coding / is_pseudo=false